MRKLLLDNAWFILPFLLFQAVGLYIIPFENKLDVFLSLHNHHHPIADIVFKMLTHVAEWYGWVGVTIIALFIKVRWALYASFSLTISGLLSQLLKKRVFPEEMRPSHFFTTDQLSLIEGVELHSKFSFPSGHTTGAFVIFLVLSILLPKKFKPFGVLFFILALSVGYSRVYLGQHFPIDVLAGAGLGVLTSLFVYWPMNAFFNRQAYPWAEKSFLSLFTPLG